MNDTIDLRCPECGSIRTPIVASPYLPEDTIVVICQECHRRALERAFLEFDAADLAGRIVQREAFTRSPS